MSSVFSILLPQDLSRGKVRGVDAPPSTRQLHGCAVTRTAAAVTHMCSPLNDMLCVDPSFRESPVCFFSRKNPYIIQTWS